MARTETVCGCLLSRVLPVYIRVRRLCFADLEWRDGRGEVGDADGGGVAGGAERDHLSGGHERAGQSVWRAADAVHRPGGRGGGGAARAGDHGDGVDGPLDFVAPVHVGDMLILKASVNRAFRTSMEVGVRAMVEDVRGADGCGMCRRRT